MLRSNWFCTNRFFLSVLVVGCLLAVTPCRLRAVTLNTGDIVITADIGPGTSGEDYGVMLVDPTTGDRTIISDDTHGTGPAITMPAGISRESDGQLLVAASNGIFRVDPATGDRSILSTIPSNGVLALGSEIFSTSVVSGTSGLCSINPVTGSPSPLLINSTVFASGLTAIGDNIFVASVNDVFSYNLSTAASQMYDVRAYAIAPDANGRLLVTGSDPLSGAPPEEIRSFDPTLPNPYGLQIVTKYNSVGSGPNLYAGPGIAIGADGQIIFNSSGEIVATTEPGQVFSVDPLTGNRTILSDATHGAGPTFLYPIGVYVVPEPATIVLGVLGALAVVACRRRFA